MKRIVTLGILFVLCVILVGAYVVINKSNENTTEPETTSDETEYVNIDTNDSSKITSFSYSINDESFQFINNNNVWQIVGQEKYPIDQTFPKAMLNSIEEILGYRVIAQENTDITEFGFDKPTCKISVTYEDSTVKTYLIGDYNSFASAYYFLIDGTKTVYTLVDKITSFFSHKLSDMIDRDDSPELPEAENIVSVDVNGNDGFSKSIIFSDSDTTLADAVSSLELGDVTGAGATDLSTFGFDSPRKVTVNYKATITSGDSGSTTVTVDKSASFLFAYADGKFYITLEGSNLCYTVKSNDADIVTSFVFPEYSK